MSKKIDPSPYAAARKLSQSIRRGTQHFDREHTKELFSECVCDDTINPDCNLHKHFLEKD